MRRWQHPRYFRKGHPQRIDTRNSKSCEARDCPFSEDCLRGRKFLPQSVCVSSLFFPLCAEAPNLLLQQMAAVEPMKLEEAEAESNMVQVGGLKPSNS
jgi:hypothetical protein